MMPSCGSGLARESDLTVSGFVDWKDAFASKPAPTFASWRHKKCVHTNVTIGAIYVCTFCFHALKSYIPAEFPCALPPPQNPSQKINTCSIGQFITNYFQTLSAHR
jgi:hypothetical protein